MNYKIADTIFNIEPLYKYTYKLCEDYLYNGEEKPVCTIKTEQKDIDNEKKTEEVFPDYYLESLAVFRKICEYLLENDKGIIFHCSAVAVDDKAYLFTAPSGTGKSTHVRLWRELLGDKAVMINDDKPIIRLIDDEFYVYGTPWMGKHKLGSNTKCKIQAICEISQAKENSIKQVEPKEILLRIINQTLMPENETKANNLFSLLDKMLKKVKLYKLKCNMEIDSAKLSYSFMANNKE